MEVNPESKRLYDLRIQAKNALTSDDYGDCLMELCEIINDQFLLQAEENESNKKMFNLVYKDLEILLEEIRLCHSSKGKQQKRAKDLAPTSAGKSKQEKVKSKQ